MNRIPRNPRHARQRGQTFLAIAVLIALLLLAILGLTTDYTQVWAHRQMAQAAADAACQAAAADLFLFGTDPTATTDFPGMNFSWISNAFDCSAKGGTPPCVYAALNGYTGSNVSVSFPSSVPGASIPPGFQPITTPYIEVVVTDPVAMSFTKLVSSTKTVNIRATAYCGVNPVTTPVPLVVLHRTSSSSLSVSGSALIKIFGGPQRSIQVDSNSATAVSVGTVNLSQAGPSSTGADFAVFGGPAAKPAGVSLGTSGNWIAGAQPFGDPFGGVSGPSKPSTGGTATPVPFRINGCPDPNGCIEFAPGDYTSCLTGTISPSQKGCLLLPYTGSNPKFSAGGPAWVANTNYTAGALIQPTNAQHNSAGYVYLATNTGSSGGTVPGSWTTTVCTPQSNGSCSGGTNPVDGTVIWQNVGLIVLNKLTTAIFDPGLYYVAANGLNLGDNSTARMSTVAGDGSNGVTFYFSTSATVGVTSNSGKSSACASVTQGPAAASGSPNGCVVSYQIAGTLSPAATAYVGSSILKCPNGSANPSQVPSTLNGNILLGPCSGTLASPDGNRGFLFFQNRSTAANASWGGGGQFLSSGFMYFHFGNGTTCGATTSCLAFQGNSGSQSYTLGNVIVDKLAMSGSPQINMILNPTATFAVLRPALLQ